MSAKFAVLALTAAAMAIVTAFYWQAGDAENPAINIVQGETLYAEHCAACHGVNLEGQPNWRQPLPEGGLPAPPHDETGHTWHHPDSLLFDYVQQGGQAIIGDRGQSNMPGFGEVLSDDEIWSILAFIKASWPERIREAQAGRNSMER